MTPVESQRLRRECTVFSDYLIGWKPNRYVLEKYCDAHQKTANYTPYSRFDRVLVRFAQTGRVTTKLADSYARWLIPASVLRKKLILLLAILETSSPAYRLVDSVTANNKPWFVLKAMQKGLLFVLSFLLAAIVLLPVHVALGVGERNASESR